MIWFFVKKIFIILFTKYIFNFEPKYFKHLLINYLLMSCQNLQFPQIKDPFHTRFVPLKKCGLKPHKVFWWAVKTSNFYKLNISLSHQIQPKKGKSDLCFPYGVWYSYLWFSIFTPNSFPYGVMNGKIYTNLSIIQFHLPHA